MKKNKLIIALYIGLISLSVASVSLSIAWYATARTLYINSIDISIDAERDLKIATERDGDYVDHISETAEDATGVFIPLTCAYSSSWMAEQKDMPVFYDESKFSENEDDDLKTVANHGYYSKKFYLKSDDDVYVTIDANKTKIEAITEKNRVYAHELFEMYQTFQEEFYKDLDEEEITKRLDRVVEAMRYSILIKDVDEYSYTIIDPYKNGDTVYGGVLDNDIDQCFDYFKVNGSDELRERAYGELVGDASGYYLDALDEDSEYVDPNDAPSAFNARHKKGVKRFNLEKAIEDKLFTVEKAFDIKDFNNPVKPLTFPVYRNTPKEIVISIYIEGWDLQSVNYTMGSAFESNLSFKIEREM